MSYPATSMHYHENWPIRKLQAQFEYFTLQTLGRETMRRYADALEAFLKHWPKRKHPQEYTRVDVEDFRVIRQREGFASTTINRDVSIICAFWNWMIDRRVLVYNIANVRPLARTTAKNRRMSLTEFTRLERELIDPRVREFVGHVLEGKKQKESAKLVGLTQRYLSILFCQAASRAGLDWIQPRNLLGVMRETALGILRERFVVSDSRP